MADEMLDASELLALAGEIDGAAEQVVAEAFPLVKRHALELRNQWRDNARETARRHGKYYPRSITAEQIPDAAAVEWEIGPDSSLPQGGMGRGFEYGGARQPPHWDGARATRAVEPIFNADVDALMRRFM
ncbi:hypothetical protein [Nonomuraea sp. bgisy101]|uniref:hypothetical protein n=1 Tax=Nonomuraea sp. bgisy101 TaxID=3413784 RepID=UPI003D75F5EA